jgi:putative SOS response-associated peptidase YedK
MCGRFVVFDDKEITEINSILREIDRKYNGTGLSAKTGEICPTNTVPVLAISEGKPALSLMRWGFPKWGGKKSVIINARAETADQKRTFAKPLAERRCVIPSTGFYEWRRDENGKTTRDKYLFTMTDSPMLYMAAVYTEVDDDNPLRERFCILTCEANESMRDIHSRMPVILYKNELTRWLTDSAFISIILGRDDVRLLRDSAKHTNRKCSTS